MTPIKLIVGSLAMASAFQAPVSRVGSSRSSAVTMKKDEPWSLAGFLSGPKKSFYGDKKDEGQLELLSGAAFPPALETLSKRFAFAYDTRPKKAVKVKSKSSKINPKDAKSW